MGPASTPTAEVRDRCVQALADSPAFRKAPAVRALLLYLWRHRDDALNEYRIATECLGKPADFDPKIDATVRVHMSRLRARLKDQGPAEGCRVSIPQGTYRLDFASEAEDPPSDRAPVPAVSPTPAAEAPRRDLRLFGMAAALAVLILACGALAWHNRRLAAQIPSRREMPRLWASFFDNAKPADVVLPTPVFFEWPENALKVRDTRINDFDDYSRSPLLEPLVKQFGPPRLMQNYTVVSDTFAAVKLAQYLQSYGVRVSFSGANDFSFDKLGDGNTVLIGLASSSLHIRRLMESTNFYSKPSEASTVYNRAPRAGEAGVYKMVQQSGSRRSVPGVVAVLPGSAPGARILMVASWASSAMISFLSSAPSLEQADQQWLRAGSPPYFEMLVHADIEGNAVLSASPVSLRPFSPAVAKAR